MKASEFATEWGVAWSLPESNGTSPVDDRAMADKMTRNMRAAGHEARVVWRSISIWQEQ